MLWTDDPIHDYAMHDMENAEWESRLPKCSYCLERIEDETLVDYDGELFHFDCFIDKAKEIADEHSVHTADYMEEP